MKNYILKFSFIFCFVILVLNCTTANHFNIRIRDQNMYNEINQLMREIYQKAKDGNVDFFRPFVQREFEESAARFAKIARQFNDDLHIEFTVHSDESMIGVTKDMMRQFVTARIYRTYRNRAFLAYNGIFFDYGNYCSRRSVRFIMGLTFDEYDRPVLYRFFGVR